MMTKAKSPVCPGCGASIDEYFSQLAGVEDFRERLWHAGCARALLSAYDRGAFEVLGDISDWKLAADKFEPYAKSRAEIELLNEEAQLRRDLRRK